MADNEYIDRHALLDDLNAAMKNSGMGYVIGQTMKRYIKRVPAADVAEVRRGEWIVTKTEHGWNCAEYPTEYTCSVCGRTEAHEEPYCHCGAKMGGERK